MLTRLCLPWAVLLLTHTAAQGGSLCEPSKVEKDSPYRYMVGVANGLVDAKEGLDRVDKASPDAYSLVVALRLQQSSFNCAASQIAPYEASSDTIISRGAQFTTAIFQHLSEVDNELVSLTKSVLDSASSTSMGDMAERQAAAQADLEETWKLLVHAVALTTYSVVRADPATGRMSRLALSAAQRDEILGILRSGFGPEVTKGMKAGQHPLVGSAAALYGVISDPGRQVQR